MSYQITDLSGVTRLMPNHQQMTSIVDEMYKNPEEEFCDVIMAHQSGCSISLHPNGCAVMEFSEQDEFFTLNHLDREDQLMLWIQLAAGNIESLKKLDWVLSE